MARAHVLCKHFSSRLSQTKLPRAFATRKSDHLDTPSIPLPRQSPVQLPAVLLAARRGLHSTGNSEILFLLFQARTLQLELERRQLGEVLFDGRADTYDRLIVRSRDERTNENTEFTVCDCDCDGIGIEIGIGIGIGIGTLNDTTTHIQREDCPCRCPSCLRICRPLAGTRLFSTRCVFLFYFILFGSWGCWCRERRLVWACWDREKRGEGV